MTANVYGVTLESLLDWINVQAAPYHADPTGVTDATAAIAAAIAAVPSTGGVVYLPSGTYLLNSSALSLLTAGTVLMGASAESTKLVIGSGFTGSAAVSIAAYNCQVRDLSIRGSSSTTTSNPACNGIEITGVRRAKVSRCTFFNINGWTVEAAATSTSSSSNVLGTQLDQLFMNACAGGIHFVGNAAQSYATNSQITDVQMYGGGVTTGPSANLDCIRIEDAWDVLTENAIVWMTNGSGSCLHVKGNCAASFTTNLDALGPSAGTGPCVLIEDGPNGSPQNTQIMGGVIQQGSPGVQISGGAFQTHISTVRIINNGTHGVTVAGTGHPIHIYNCMFNLNGADATGTNYDLNWSGTAQGKVGFCWFGSAIVASGTAGVQQSINIGTAGQAVLVAEAAFQGSGASSANWFTNLPAGVQESSSGAVNFPTGVTLGGGVTVVGQTTTRPSTNGATALSVNVGGNDLFDRFRLLGDGSWHVGPGTATRDTAYGRAGTGIGYVTNTLLVGASTPLGDNGVGEIQLVDATTVPTTSPTGGSVIYSQSGTSTPVKMRDPSGNVRGLISADVISASSETTTATAQTASTHLVLAVEASATYLMDAMLIIETPSGVDFTHSWTGPSGATMSWGDATGTAVSTIGGTDTWTGIGAPKCAILRGTLTTSATAGNLVVTFASGTSGQTATLAAGGWVQLARVK